MGIYKKLKNSIKRKVKNKQKKLNKTIKIIKKKGKKI